MYEMNVIISSNDLIRFLKKKLIIHTLHGILLLFKCW